jgi:transposase
LIDGDKNNAVDFGDYLLENMYTLVDVAVAWSLANGCRFRILAHSHRSISSGSVVRRRSSN